MLLIFDHWSKRGWGRGHLVGGVREGEEDGVRVVAAENGHRRLWLGRVLS